MKILYICTHNRCRSILAEAVTNQFGQGILEARSAGSQPAGVVHPLSLKYLQQSGIDIEGLRSQSWDAFEAWSPDVVITVCDSAAGESCPVWFGQSLKVHWGLSDPSALDASEEQVTLAFQRTIKTLKGRVEAIVASRLDPGNAEALRSLLLDLANSDSV